MDFPSFAPLLALAPDPGNAPGEVVVRVARQFLDSPPEFSVAHAVLAGFVGALIQVLAYWIAAKVVVGNERGTLARAAHLWLLSLLAAFGLAILLVIGLAAAAGWPPVLLTVAAGGWALLAFLVALLLPAKVFATGLRRSMAILLLSGILILAGQTALQRGLGGPALVRWPAVQRVLFDSPAGRQRRFRHLLAGDPLALIEAQLDQLAQPAERKKSFSERQAALRAVFASLEAQRKLLKPDDDPGRADYEAVRQRYEELVKLMRADYTASLVPSAAR